MDRKELFSFLKSEGYYLLRNSKHKIYTNGHHKVSVPQGSKLDRRLAKMIRLQIERNKDATNTNKGMA